MSKSISSKNIFTLIIAFIFIISTLVLFSPVIHYYFFQDDWLVLNLTNNISLKDFVSLFTFRTDVIYYRPVGMFVYFYLSKLLFGLNPFNFHIVSFGIFLTNSIILFLILKNIFKNNIAAMFSTFIYSTAAFHFMSLSWLALTWNIIGSFFFLLATYFYLLSTSTKVNRNTFLSLLFFCLSLGSTEFAVAFPIFIVLCDFFKSQQLFYSFQKSFKVTLPTIFIICIYLILRFIVYSFPAQSEYKISIDFSFIKNLFWYFVWLINVPDEVRYQIIISKLRITDNLLNVSKYLIYTILIWPFVFILSALILFRDSIKNNLVIIIFAFLCFIICLSPVLFLTNHSFSYYLEIASLPLILLICQLFAETIKKIQFNRCNIVITSIILIGWFSSSFLTINLNRKIHWITAEQNISKNAIKKISTDLPYLPYNSVVYIKPSTPQLEQSLMGQNALQVVYKDSSIQTIFYDEKQYLQLSEKNVYYVNLK